jgi:hypothetical protein
MEIQPVFFIDTFDIHSNYSTLEAAMDAARTIYEPDARIYIYKSYDDEGEGAVEVAWRGDVSKLPSKMDVL